MGAELPRKPAEGALCNGCCVATPCGMAMILLPAARVGKPCPAVEWDEKRAWCGLVRNPLAHLPESAAELGLADNEAADVISKAVHLRQGMGRGCDSGPPERFLGIFRQRDPDKGKTAAEYLAELDDGD